MCGRTEQLLGTVCFMTTEKEDEEEEEEEERRKTKDKEGTRRRYMSSQHDEGGMWKPIVFLYYEYEL